MTTKKKTIQKKIKEVVPVEKPKDSIEATEMTETEITTSKLFVFRARFGTIIFSSPMLNCDKTTMEKMIVEYKRVHDLKDLTTVSVAPFIKWMVEDRGFKTTTDNVVDVLWT